MRILFAAPIGFDRITIFVSQYFIGLARAARQLGHEVKVVQTTENLYNPILWKFLEREFATLRRHVKPLADLPHDLLLMHQLNNEVEDFDPDLILIHLIDTVYVPTLIKKYKKKDIPVFVWLGVHPSQVSSGMHELLRAAARTLIYDPSYIPYYKNHLHIDNIAIVPLGCDVTYYESINPDEDFRREHASDLCFVGLFDYYREKFLKVLTEYNLSIWSWNLPEYETALRTHYKGEAYGNKMIKLFKSAKIVLNIHREFERSGGNFRLFEIPACGVLQLVDEKTSIRNYFEPGREIITFVNEYDLKEKVNYYLHHPDERNAIAQAGYQRVRKDHSLIQRAEQIVSLVGST